MLDICSMSNYSVSKAEHMFNQHSYSLGTERESSLLHHPSHIRPVPLGPLGRRHCLPSLKLDWRHVIPAPHVSCSAHGGAKSTTWENVAWGGRDRSAYQKGVENIKQTHPTPLSCPDGVYRALGEGQEQVAYSRGRYAAQQIENNGVIG